MLRTQKSQRTRLYKKITDELTKGRKLIGGDLPEGELETLTSQIDVSVSILGEYQKRFEALSDQISGGMDGLDDEEIDREGEYVMDTITEITETICQLYAIQKSLANRMLQPGRLACDTGMVALQQKIDKLVELQSLRVSAEGSHDLSRSSSPSQRFNHSVKLPKLQFDRFSGDVLRFREFWDSFETAIHSNPCLQPVEKLNYLRSYLVGEAKNVISGVSTCEANYDVAVELIKKRFGNPQASIDAHYSHLAGLSAVPNHTTRVRFLFDEVEKHLRCLSALGEDTEHRHFISLIMSKLPREVIVRLEESKTDDESWSVDLLRRKLQSLLNAREAAERQRSTNHSSWNPSDVGRNNAVAGSSSGGRSSFNKSWLGPKSAVHSTTESLVASERQLARTSKPSCIFCSGMHYSDQCRNYRSVEDRRRRLTGRCFLCLQKGHQTPQCTYSKPCFHCKQVKKHNRCLCPDKFSSKAETSAVTVEGSTERSCSSCQCSNSVSNLVPQHAVLSSGDRVLLQTATVEVKNHDGTAQVFTRALLDCASNRSYISSSLASKLNVKSSGSEIFSVVTFGSEKPKTVETTTAKIQLVLKDSSAKVLDVNVVPKITGAIHRSPIKFDKSHFLWKDLPLADSLPKETDNAPVDFLIGNDYYLDLVTSEKIQINNGLYLLGSHLGWLLTGRVEGEKTHDPSLTMIVSSLLNNSVSELCLYTPIDKSTPLQPSFEDFWKLETIGIAEKPDENDDDRALTKFCSTVKMRNGRYEVSWPWKDSCPDLPDNYELALGRFKSLLKKFQSDNALLSQYSAIIKDQENKGIIEKVDVDLSSVSTLNHYIPHHPVVTPQKATTKVRIVYDASAKVRKGAKSLNECLLRGPVILEDMCGLLLRFRTSQVAVVADIEKAFLQVALRIADRDVVRFLWLKDESNPLLKNNLQGYRFCRVPFGVISSPFLLSATVKYHLQQARCQVAQKMCENLYVDNVITGVDSPHEAVKFYSQAKKIFQEASMNLREWASNSREFMDQVPDNDKVKCSYFKVLGLGWHIVNDCLSVSGQPAPEMAVASTKREMLKALASIFDPLGFFAPLTVKAKIFIHQLWSKDFKWDDKVDELMKDEWKLIASELSKIPSHKIERFIGISSKESATYQLVCFCDASALAYSAVVYLKITCSGKNEVNMVFAKTRLPPSKGTSIPRLELLAALIGVRCLNFVQRQLRLPIENMTLWSDSQCVLHWLKSTKPLPVFIENRLREMRNHKEISFRYVSTTENPADLATRGKATLQEMDTSFWWRGPRWLAKRDDYWPVWKFNVPRDSLDPDQTVTASNSTRLYEAGILSCQKDVPVSPPFTIKVDKYSSLMRLYRVTSWITRFVKKVQRQPVESGTIVSSELMAAKILWDKHIQKTSFPEIFSAIKSGIKCNLKEQLNVQLDKNGILRCYGRFLNADLPHDVKFPKLLPKHGHYTDLIVRHYHQRLLHGGVSHTLSQIRLEYWISHGRSVIRQTISKCLICRRHDGGPYKVPHMPPWPACRVSRSSPFSYTGLDYLGPLYVRTTQTQPKKVWVCLFTCLSVRAVHLELVQDMSAEQFLLCIRRFIARRGKPIQIISDNAAQFKVSKYVMDRVWRKVVSDPDVKSYISCEGIVWKFIVERAPWMGGFYERLVGSVKRALKKGLGKICLSMSQMATSLSEVEAVVNSRPITYVGDDLERGFGISPSNFLCLNPKAGVPLIEPGDSPDDPTVMLTRDTAVDLISTWKKGHKLLDAFWRIWKEDYLSGLRERCDYLHKQSRVLSDIYPQKGQVVLIKDDGLPRGSWKIGKIEEFIPSSDGELRAVRLKVSSGRLLNRPLKLLYPLEAPPIENETTNRDCRSEDMRVCASNKQLCGGVASRLPRRSAAIKALHNLKQQLASD